MNNLGTILGIWAHPDDETFTSAGLMMDAIDRGERVVCITATRGEKGSQDERKWPSEEMGEVREKELAECLAVIGVKEHHFLDYIDGECDRIDDAAAEAKIDKIFRMVDPDSIFTFGPDGYTDHPDHKMVSDWATEVFKQSAKPGAKLYYVTVTQAWKDRFYPTMQRFNVFENDTPAVTPENELAINFKLSPDLIERKIESLKVQKSQVEHMFAAFGEDFFRGSFRFEPFRLGLTK